MQGSELKPILIRRNFCRLHSCLFLKTALPCGGAGLDRAAVQRTMQQRYQARQNIATGRAPPPQKLTSAYYVRKLLFSLDGSYLFVVTSAHIACFTSRDGNQAWRRSMKSVHDDHQTLAGSLPSEETGFYKWRCDADSVVGTGWSCDSNEDISRALPGELHVAHLCIQSGVTGRGVAIPVRPPQDPEMFDLQFEVGYDQQFSHSRHFVVAAIRALAPHPNNCPGHDFGLICVTNLIVLLDAKAGALMKTLTAGGAWEFAKHSRTALAFSWDDTMLFAMGLLIRVQDASTIADLVDADVFRFTLFAVGAPMTTVQFDKTDSSIGATCHFPSVAQSHGLAVVFDMSSCQELFRVHNKFFFGFLTARNCALLVDAAPPWPHGPVETSGKIAEVWSLELRVLVQSIELHTTIALSILDDDITIGRPHSAFTITRLSGPGKQMHCEGGSALWSMKAGGGTSFPNFPLEVLLGNHVWCAVQLSVCLLFHIHERLQRRSGVSIAIQIMRAAAATAGLAQRST